MWISLAAFPACTVTVFAPQHARTLNQAVLFVIARALKIRYNEPKKNQLYLSQKIEAMTQEEG